MEKSKVKDLEVAIQKVEKVNALIEDIQEAQIKFWW